MQGKSNKMLIFRFVCGILKKSKREGYHMSDTYFETLADCENGETTASVTGERKKVFLIGDSIRQ
jgi:hypothetical protein